MSHTCPQAAVIEWATAQYDVLATEPDDPDADARENAYRLLVLLATTCNPIFGTVYGHTLQTWSNVMGISVAAAAEAIDILAAYDLAWFAGNGTHRLVLVNVPDFVDVAAPF